MRGLYVHIPFCVRKCHYCNFVITTNRSPQMRGRFFTALSREIDQSALRHGKLTVDTLYFGGGTPSVLEPTEFSALITHVRQNFCMTPSAEITCEVNPDDVSPEKLETYKRFGINRISVGVQSLNDRLLHKMGRIHNATTVRGTFDLLRRTGFSNISADLILRLPGQTVEDLLSSIREIIHRGAAQVVLYDLDIHEKTVYGQRQRQGRLDLPTETVHQQMFEEAVDLLESDGFDQYEVSSFAKPGFESKHNLMYWNNEEYLGFGPGAFSYLRGSRSQFAKSVKDYLNKCEKNDWENEEMEEISEENRQIETLLTGIRLTCGIHLENLPILRPRLKEIIPALAKEGLLKYHDDTVRLTRRGRCVAESVISHLVNSVVPPLSREKR